MRRLIQQGDFTAVRRGFVAAGLDEEFFNGDDIVRLWNRGLSVADIVQTAVAYAARCGTTSATSSPT